MKIVKNVLIDIHYRKDERDKAEQEAKRYEKLLFSREDDSEDCIQLLKTYTLRER
jgi:hypothetical protein